MLSGRISEPSSMLEVLLGDLRRHHQGLQAERQVGSNEDRCHVADLDGGCEKGGVRTLPAFLENLVIYSPQN